MSMEDVAAGALFVFYTLAICFGLGFFVGWLVFG